VPEDDGSDSTSGQVGIRCIRCIRLLSKLGVDCPASSPVPTTKHLSTCSVEVTTVVVEESAKNPLKSHSARLLLPCPLLSCPGMSFDVGMVTIKADKIADGGFRRWGGVGFTGASAWRGGRCV
jgi:hypothetical protein